MAAVSIPGTLNDLKEVIDTQADKQDLFTHCRLEADNRTRVEIIESAD